MSLLFADVCNLFEHLESIQTKQPPLLPADRADRIRCTVQAWFKQRRTALDKLNIKSTVAVLSTFLPERRPDRVYGLQSQSLSRVLSRALSSGSAHITALQAYRQPGRGDLGQCLQRIVEKTGPPALPKVTVDDIDRLLELLASQCRFSAPSVRKVPSSSSESRDQWIAGVIKRLPGRDAKWFVRLILKNLSPLVMDDRFILESFHFLLPDLLRFQQDFDPAVEALKTTLRAYPSMIDNAAKRLLKLNASSMLRPRIGTKIGRPCFEKARSIQHCLNMTGKRSWVIERKYDGEYCEIHIDRSLSRDPARCIKIFSKSAKDATADRKDIIPTLVRCLRLDKPDCAIEKEAVLLGELVVWSDTTQNVLPFEEIRKHVMRSGTRLGAARDSRPFDGEHLSIVFFDLLLLDDRLMLKETVEMRRQALKQVYTKIPGWAKSAEWKVIDFSEADVSKRRLMQQFAASNAMACEGLVLKPCGVPYFSLVQDDEKFRHHFIKLKKDYIDGLGDEADFAVIGGSYDAAEAARCGVPGVKWTHFYLATLLNKDEVQRYERRPHFKLVGRIAQHMCLPKPVLAISNQLGMLSAIEDPSQAPFDVDLDSEFRVDTWFAEPLVFEVLGSGFVKPSNCDFFMLRHSRVKKLHTDRSWRDCVSFTELQQHAIDARMIGGDTESQENRHELARLERSMKRKFERQLSKTPSPVKRVQREEDVAHVDERSALGELSINRESGSSHSRRSEKHEAPAPVQERQHVVRKRAAAVMANPTVVKRRRISIHTFDDTPHSKSLARSQTTTRQTCIVRDCVLSRAALYFSSCVAATPYITSDLTSLHAATRVECWRDWLRQEREQHSHGSVIAESQAYPGLRRIIVVESRRKQALKSLVDTILAERDGCRVHAEIWDWRVLEMTQDHCTTLGEHEHFFLGSIAWDEATHMSVWRPNGLTE